MCGSFDQKNLHENLLATKIKIREKAKLPAIEELKQRIDKLNTQMGLAVMDATQQICEIIENLKEFHDHSTDLILNSQKASRFSFSQELKHDCIEIREKEVVNKFFDSKTVCMQNSTTRWSWCRP